ncbi:MAG TPA: DNA/RNA non-specific endonuclease, partial [Thermoanaerobaculia bacterium]|nr:DNA/RNA non-specific endonuclease [Thermoanaerobaculia bacterium]
MNLRRTSVLLLLCFGFLAQAATAASPDIVISQVYGGGGASSGTPAYTNDYVELFNTTNAPVVIGGRSLQYGSSTGNFGNSGNIFTFPAGTTIPAGRYLLVKTGGTGALGAAFTADFTTGGLSMAAGAGKVALVTTGTALGCGATATLCTLPDARIIDSVAWGGSTNGEGGTTVNNGSALNSALGGIRKSNGCQDTDNNNADFVVGTTGSGLIPRTSASAPHSCGAVNQAPTITAPANPAATVTQDDAPFIVNLTGNDDDGVYNWSATAGSGVSSVNVTAGQGSANVTFTVSLLAGFNGTATFTASLSDNVNPAVTTAVNIQVNSLIANDPPSISAPADPIATVAQDAAPFAVSLSGSDDNNVFIWSALAGSGVSNVAVSGGQGTSSAAFTVTLQPGFSGTASFTASLSDGVTAPGTQVVNITVTPAPPPPLDHMVISQIYGGGGNSGAIFREDFVELYNPSTTPFDLGGWTIQYASAGGSSWQAQPLGGIVQPGEYYLISLASGANGAALPLPNVDGSINMSATAGKVALVSAGDPLEGGCPLGDPTIVDLVGFGTTASCREGATNAPGGNNTTAILRKNGGFTDTNVNGADFVTGTPNPRRTTPIVEIGPYVLSTDPRTNASAAPRDANISVTFTEPVDTAGAWFDINCATTGSHNDATVAVVPGSRTWVIVPNVNFLAGEQCTLTVFKNNVTDQDLDDGGVNTDTLTANYSWTFSIATGTAPEYAPDVHVTFGNPSDAETDLLTPDNYLMLKPELALSYNRSRGTANWVSWHLDDTWTGFLSRVDTFRADPAVPPDWYRVLATDYTNTGFDRGHMVPNADRNPETSIPINQATFLMTNMIPQSPDNNQGPWADLENFLRTLLPANEVYVVAGGAGTGGTGSNGFATTIANGNVTVPAQTWKVALVLPKDGGDDVSRVTAGTRTIAVIMPNVQGIRNIDWTNYLTTVDAVESLTGYDLFENVGNLVENAIEAGVNGVNPPG